jgi:predicted protein tyrosine phosphatase
MLANPVREKKFIVADAVNEVVRQRPMADPNPKIIDIADRHLGLEGRLVAAVDGMRSARISRRLVAEALEP